MDEVNENTRKTTKKKTSKNKKKKEAAKEKEEKKVAMRVISKINLILLPMAEMEERLTPTLKAELPEFQIKDFEASGQQLKDLVTKWSHILKGKSSRKQERVDELSTTHKVTQFRTALAGFGRLVDGAEAIAAKKDKKKSKKDKDEKKRSKSEKRTRRGL